MGGNSHEGVAPIPADRIDDTVAPLGEHLNIPFFSLKEGYLGSTGKRQVSNDIDIVLPETQFQKGEVVARLRQALGETSVRLLPNGIITVKVPQAGKKDFAQVDLMIGDPAWSKFAFHSPDEGESEYKGLFRSQLLRAVAKSLRQQELDLDDDSVVAEAGPSMDYLRGIETVHKARPMRRDGQARTKQLIRVTSQEFAKLHPRLKVPDLKTRNPQVAADALFGKGTRLSLLRSFESVSDLISRTKNPVQKERIFRNYKEIIEKRLGLRLPKSGFWSE